MKIKITKKIILIAVSIVLVATFSVAALEKTGVTDFFGSKNKSEDTPATVDMNPPTEDDKKQAEDNKKRIVEEDKRIAEQQQNPSSQVTPSITYADQYNDNVEVGAIVPVFEDGGKCTLTLSRNGVSIKKSVTAVKNARSVDCPVMTVNRSELNTTGIWSAIVSYESSAFQGTSNSRDIEVK